MIDPDFWRGRRVLVTGHTGFKGAWLTLWLSQLGATVTGLSDRVPTTPSLYELCGVEQDAQTVFADVRDAAAVRSAVLDAEPEVVLHLAAQPLVRRSYAEPAETFAVNVVGTAYLLDAVRDVGGVGAVVVVTSDKCYAPGPDAHVEGDPLGGDDPYSASKAAQEHVAAAYRESYGLPIACGRAGNVIGGGDWGADRLLPDVVEAMLSGRAVELRNPNAVRPWQHVLNPLAGYLLLAQAVHSDAQRFASGWNFGPEAGDELSVQALVDRMSALWDEPVATTVQSGEHPAEAPTLRLDSTKARSELRWFPGWSIDEALDAIVDWYRRLRIGDPARKTTLAQIERFAVTAEGRGR